MGEVGGASRAGFVAAGTGGPFAEQQQQPTRVAGQSAPRAHRQWDDEFVLKRQFSALIPAFDPRPGRTNVNQTLDVELPPVIDEHPSPETPRPIGAAGSRQASHCGAFKEPRMRLLMKGPNLPNVTDVTVLLDNEDQSLFVYVQKLIQMADWGGKTDKSRRVWEPTYVLVYEEAAEDGEEGASSSDMDDSLRKKSPEEFVEQQQVDQVLDVLAQLRLLAETSADLEIGPDEFISDKLAQKLTQELADPLVVAARALPQWCDRLVYDYPSLFSTATRTMYLKATSFGTSRAIVWLQGRRDQVRFFLLHN